MFIETIQSLYAIQTKNLVDLSIQQVIDCCTEALNNPFQCISSSLGGLCLAKDYPNSELVCNTTICKPIALVGY